MTRILNRIRSSQSQPRVGWNEIFWAWSGSCLSVACLALLEKVCAQEWNLPLLIGSFGASAVLAQLVVPGTDGIGDPGIFTLGLALLFLIGSVATTWIGVILPKVGG